MSEPTALSFGRWGVFLSLPQSSCAEQQSRQKSHTVCGHINCTASTYTCPSSGIMPCKLVNSHISEGLATSIVRVVQKQAIFFFAYADAKGKLLGFSICTRIYKASCPRRLEFYSLLRLRHFRDHEQTTSQFTSL